MVAPFIPTNEAYSYDATGNGQEAMRWVDSDGSGTGQILRLTNRYLWADSVDQLLSDEQYWNNTGMAINATTSSTVVGNTLWTLGDHLGSIRDLLDNNGVIREHQVFDSYGRLVREVDYNSAGQVIASNDASAVDTVFGYTGRSWDTDVNLQYNRARWYDPQTGRWLSQDPIGLGPDVNMYRYVGNSPTNYTDPSGLDKLSPQQIADARKEMEGRGLSAREIALRLAILQNVANGRVKLPGAGSTGSRDPNYWIERDGDGPYVPKGAPSDAVNHLWIDGDNRILCNKYTKLIILKSFYDIASKTERDAMDAKLKGKVYPDDVEDQDLMWEDSDAFDVKDLLPGDQIWIKNPYWFKVNPEFWNKVYPNPPAGLSAERKKTYTYADHYRGEEGSNLFYAGNGMVIGIYSREVMSLEDYKKGMRGWNVSKDWDRFHKDNPCQPSDFEIRTNNRPSLR